MQRNFIIEEQDGLSSRFEVGFDYFNSEFRFCIFRNFIVNEWCDLKGNPRDYNSKIWALKCWICIHKEQFEEVTPEELFNNPAAKRKTNSKTIKENPLVIKKKSISNNLIFIDLTIEEDRSSKEKQVRRIQKRREIKDQKSKFCFDSDLNRRNLKEKTPKPQKQESYFKHSNKKVHRSKEELNKKSEKKRYNYSREENQCFLYALRQLSPRFSFDLYRETFRDLNFNEQVQLANVFLEKDLKEKLIFGGKSIATLKMVKENNRGKFLCAFLHENTLHCEAIIENQYSREMTKDIKDIENEEGTFSLYFLRKIEN